LQTLGESSGQLPSGMVRGFWADGGKLEPALWTFVSVEGVEPTNNAAERALRPAVLWRKGCFGADSSAGNGFVAKILTVAATGRQHNKRL
jgi:transposase